MSKTTNRKPDAEMLPEYDFAHGHRGKYSRRFAEGTNIVVLDPDVARAFPDPRVLNDLLRSWVTAAEAMTKTRTKTRRRKK